MRKRWRWYLLLKLQSRLFFTQMRYEFRADEKPSRKSWTFITQRSPSDYSESDLLSSTRSKIWRAVALRFGLAVVTDEKEQPDCRINLKMTIEGPGMPQTLDRCLASSASNTNVHHRLRSERRLKRDPPSRHMYLFRCWQKYKSYWHDLSPKHSCWHSKWQSHWMTIKSIVYFIETV